MDEQEPRGERAHAMVTAAEKRAIKLVALAWDTTESDLLRDYTIAQIVAEARNVEAVLPGRPVSESAA